MFQGIIPYLLASSQRIPSIPYHEVSVEEANELEINEKGVNIMTFREQASEIILRTYFMMQANFQEEGQTSFFTVLLTHLVPSDPY